jgi:hypothetical protein
MRKSTTAALCFPLCLAVASAAPSPLPLGDGAKAKTTVYQATLGSIEFSTEIDNILFALTSLQSKYKVVRINVRNRGRDTLRFSKSKDQVMLFFPDAAAGRVGLLDLQRRDPAVWDGLESELRAMLVYPELVEPGEEENVFVFIPDPTLTRLPVHVDFMVSSANRTVALRHPVSKK